MIIDSRKYERVKGILNAINCREDVIYVPEDVTEIGSSAFDECYRMERIVMNRGLTRIHKGAFKSCRFLKRVDLADVASWCVVQRDDAEASPFCKERKGEFYVDNNPLTELVLTADIKSVGDHAFANCQGLRSVTVEGDATDIGSEVFAGCENLEKFDMPGLCSWFGAKSLCRGPMDKNGLWELLADGKPVTELTVPSWVTHIPAHTFYGCKSLKRVILHSGVRSIGAGALGYCPEITRVDISDPVGWYGINGGDDFAFPESNPDAEIYCNGEPFVYNRVPDGIQAIGSYRFAWLSVESDILIPNSVTSIGDGAFMGLYGQRKIAVPPSVTEIGSRVFSGSGVEDVEICEGVKSIGAGAFEKCESLRFFSVPDSVKVIADGAFSECVSLASVGFGCGSALRKIGEKAFYNCSSLRAAELPDGVESIGRAAFGECDGLSVFTVPKYLRILDPSVLSGCSSLAAIHMSLRKLCVLGRNLAIDRSSEFLCYALRGFAMRYCQGGLKRRELDEWLPFVDYASERFVDKEVEDPNLCRLFIDRGLINADRGEKLLEGVKNAETRSLLMRLIYRERGVLDPEWVFSDMELDLGFDDDTELALELPEEEKYGEEKCEEAEKTDESQPYKSGREISAFFKRLFVKGRKRKNTGRRELALDDFVISIENGVATLEGYTGDGIRVTVPQFFKGVPLCRIGDGAFKGKLKLDKVFLPEGITAIEAKAFEGCENLTSITLPSTLTELGEGVFHGCRSLYQLDPIPDGVRVIPRGAFSGCRMLSQAVIGRGVTVISEYAFCDCDSLSEFNSACCERVKDFAFLGCDELEVFTANEFLCFISDTAFIGKEEKLFIKTGGKHYAAQYAKKMGIDHGDTYNPMRTSYWWF